MTDTDALISRADIMQAAGRIAPLPAAVSRLLEVTARDDFSAADVVEVVQYDAALAGDVIARANSAASASRRTIGDVREAAARIGASSVVEIAVARAMSDRLSGPVPAYGLPPDALWRHGLIASVAADTIRRAATVPVPSVLTTTALVHDIGKIVIGSCLPEAFVGALLSAAETESISIPEAERQVLGLDHGEVSGVVARTWGMPVTVQAAMTRHHDLDGTRDTLSHALVLADSIAHAVDELEPASDDDEERGLDELVPGIDQSLTICGIPAGKVPDLVTDTADAAGSVLAAFG